MIDFPSKKSRVWRYRLIAAQQIRGAQHSKIYPRARIFARPTSLAHQKRFSFPSEVSYTQKIPVRRTSEKVLNYDYAIIGLYFISPVTAFDVYVTLFLRYRDNKPERVTPRAQIEFPKNVLNILPFLPLQTELIWFPANRAPRWKIASYLLIESVKTFPRDNAKAGASTTRDNINEEETNHIFLASTQFSRRWTNHARKTNAI